MGKLGAMVLLGAAFLAGKGLERSVYIGENVSMAEPEKEQSRGVDIAVRFTSDGTAYVYMGGTVPGLTAADGQPVKIRRVKTVDNWR
jgi:hypothetical protein